MFGPQDKYRNKNNSFFLCFFNTIVPIAWTFSSEQTAACLVSLVAALSVNLLILPGSILALPFGLHSALERPKKRRSFSVGLWLFPWRTNSSHSEDLVSALESPQAQVGAPLAAPVCQGLRIYRARKSGGTQQWICVLGISQPMLSTSCARARVCFF